VKGAAIIFVVFDVNSKELFLNKINLLILKLDQESFNSVINWINFIKNIENPMIVLCGNKSDLNER